jgi:hypothetical protein
VGTDPELVKAIDSVSLKLKAKRPKNSLLNKDKWKAAKLAEVTEWDISLKSMLPEIVAELNQVEEA